MLQLECRRTLETVEEYPEPFKPKKSQKWLWKPVLGRHRVAGAQFLQPTHSLDLSALDVELVTIRRLFELLESIAQKGRGLKRLRFGEAEPQKRVRFIRGTIRRH